jgi:Icc-related predicted phosphoesterase
VKILTISDTVERRLYSLQCKELFSDVELILSCGDLPFYYLEFLVTMLNVPLYYIFGNHHTLPMITAGGEERDSPGGCINIDNRIVEFNGLLIGGFEGCMLYNYGPKQYSERQMRVKILRMKPQLWKNKLFKNRYLDILITHAPPLGIHDHPDRCHNGFKSFRKFIERYKPRYFIHGHTHRYGLQEAWKTEYQETTVINTFGYQTLEIE